MKLCNTCKKEKPESEFYGRVSNKRSKKTGHLRTYRAIANTCTQCDKLKVLERQIKKSKFDTMKDKGCALGCGPLTELKPTRVKGFILSRHYVCGEGHQITMVL